MKLQGKGQDTRFPFSVERLERLPIPKEGPATYFDRDVRQLCLRVQPSGTRTFFVLKRTHGVTYRKTFGQWPDLKIEAARRHAHRLLNEVADWKAGGYQGICPLARASDDELTFASAFEMYVRSPRKRAKDPVKAEATSRWLLDHYLGLLKNRKVDSITGPQLANLHEQITDSHGPTAANRALEVVRATFNLAIRKNLVATNPAAGATMNRHTKRDRFLQPDELLRLEEALAEEKNLDLRDFVVLLLKTGVRKSNLYAAQWSDISFELQHWTIPGEQSKTGDVLTVELTPVALAVFKNRLRQRENESPWVFPSSTAASGHVEDFKRQWYRLLKRANISGVTMHDCRRTCGSYQHIAGSSLGVIGASLGHKSIASTEIYARLHQSAVRRSLIEGEKMQRKMVAEARKNAKPRLLANG